MYRGFVGGYRNWVASSEMEIDRDVELYMYHKDAFVSLVCAVGGFLHSSMACLDHILQSVPYLCCC